MCFNVLHHRVIKNRSAKKNTGFELVYFLVNC